MFLMLVTIFWLQEAEFMCLIACLLNQNGDYAYNMVRSLCLKVN